MGASPRTQAVDISLRVPEMAMGARQHWWLPSSRPSTPDPIRGTTAAIDLAISPPRNIERRPASWSVSGGETSPADHTRGRQDPCVPACRTQLVPHEWEGNQALAQWDYWLGILCQVGLLARDSRQSFCRAQSPPPSVGRRIGAGESFLRSAPTIGRGRGKDTATKVKSVRLERKALRDGGCDRLLDRLMDGPSLRRAS